MRFMFRITSLIIGLLAATLWLDHCFKNDQLEKASLLNKKNTGKADFFRSCDPDITEKTISKLKKEMIVPPNFQLPHNLKRKMRNNDYSQYEEVPEMFHTYFPKKRDGFFLEAGAFDGETYSNTLQAELNFNWTGILIEPQHENFQILKSKRRKAFILEACLDDVCGIQEKPFGGSGVGGMLIQEENAASSTVKCISISDVLSALDVKHIDWMVLDTEGNEADIIRSFPWNSVSVDIIQIEVVVEMQLNINSINFFKDFLNHAGFQEDASTFSDMIFRRINSTLPTRDGPKFSGSVPNHWLNSKLKQNLK